MLKCLLKKKKKVKIYHPKKRNNKNPTPAFIRRVHNLEVERFYKLVCKQSISVCFFFLKDPSERTLKRPVCSLIGWRNKPEA